MPEEGDDEVVVIVAAVAEEVGSLVGGEAQGGGFVMTDERVGTPTQVATVAHPARGQQGWLGLVRGDNVENMDTTR